MRNILFALACLTFLPLQGAQAKGPVVVELFSQPGCVVYEDLQAKMLEDLQKNPDIIIINCRNTNALDGAWPIFMSAYCGERLKTYQDRLQKGYIFAPSETGVVNGHWTFPTDMMPAVGLGRKDTVHKVQIEKQKGKDILNISLPDVTLNQPVYLKLYSYAPTQRRNQAVEVMNHLDPSHALLRKIYSDEKDANIVSAAKDSVVIRPMVTHESLGIWEGEETKMAVPLKTIKAFAGYHYESLSYVVAGHLGDPHGQIVIAGQWMSAAQQAAMIPKSVKKDIKFTTLPPQDR